MQKTTPSKTQVATEVRESMGSSVRCEWARGETGGWFSRVLSRHPRYGYRWSKWMPSGAPPAAAEYTAAEAQEHADYGSVKYGSIPVRDGITRRVPRA